MTEKEKLLENLVTKSGKSKDELNKLISDKVNELSGLVSEEGAIYIIANELGVRLDSERPKKEASLAKVEDITEAKVPVSLMCKVIRKYDKVTFSSKNGGEGSVQSLLVGDESGVTRIVFWNEKTELLDTIQEGDVLKIVNAYTRENVNSERIEVHYGQYSDIEVNPEGITIEVPEFKGSMEFTEKKVSDIEEGDRNIKINGLITDFDIPRFYFACPECFKKVFQDDGVQKCAEHGEVKAIKVPIVNIVVDDGSGSISVVGFRDRAEHLTQSNSDELIGLTEDVDKYKAFSKKMIGSKVEFGGNVSTNNMTGEPQILANQVIHLDVKTVDEIADELVKESGDSLNTAKSEESTTEIPTTSMDDIDDIEIEEIDIDDDLL